MTIELSNTLDDKAFEIRERLTGLIQQRSDASPRSLQKALGPSDIAHPCTRKMAYKLLDIKGTNPPFDILPTVIGTAVHAWLDSAVSHANNVLGRQRYLAETRVNPADWLSGSCDLFDAEEGIVTDWKGVELHTPIPTPAGWTTMGQLEVGDQVIDSAGNPCNVVETFPVNERDCYRIVFEDDAAIICDDIHEWPVIYGQKIGKGPLKGKYREKLMTAPEMRKQLRDSSGQLHIRVANTEPLQLPETELPIEPYLLGAWLGDGASNSGLITKPDLELFENIEAAGAVIQRHSLREDGLRTVRIEGLTQKLRENGLWRPAPSARDELRQGELPGHKHIPSQYLRASHTQRLALLQGLMDTDGSWNKIRNQAIFCTSSKELAGQVAELVSTLGWKPRVWELQKHGYGLTVTAYDVTFIPYDDNPFRLTRKAELVRLQGTTQAKRRIIKSVERTLTVPTRCIQVDSPDNTYLCGTEMIPTHNCLGNSSMKKYKREMNPAYRTQTALYGLGFERAGHTVKYISVMMIPRAGLLTGAHLWVEPYDRAVAQEALDRYERTLCLMSDLRVEENPEHLRLLEKAGDSCLFCPFWSPNPEGPYQCEGVQETY